MMTATSEESSREEVWSGFLGRVKTLTTLETKENNTLMEKLDKKIDKVHSKIKINVGKMVEQIHQEVHSDISEIRKKIDMLVGGHAKKRISDVMRKSVSDL